MRLRIKTRKSGCKVYLNIKPVQGHFWHWCPHDWCCWVDNGRRCPYGNGILAKHSIFWLTVHFLHDSIHRLHTYTSSLVCCLSYLSVSIVSNFKGLDLYAQKWNTTHLENFGLHTMGPPNIKLSGKVRCLCLVLDVLDDLGRSITHESVTPMPWEK